MSVQHSKALLLSHAMLVIHIWSLNDCSRHQPFTCNYTFIHTTLVKTQTIRGTMRQPVMCLAHLRAFIQQPRSALKQACGWRLMDVIAKIAYLTSFNLWPTYMTFWPPQYFGGQYRASTNQVWLQTGIWLETYQPLQSLEGTLLHLTSFELWPTYVTFDPRISWRPI